MYFQTPLFFLKRSDLPMCFTPENTKTIFMWISHTSHSLIEILQLIFERKVCKDIE